jgi:hypothetical protein
MGLGRTRPGPLARRAGRFRPEHWFRQVLSVVQDADGRPLGFFGYSAFFHHPDDTDAQLLVGALALAPASGWVTVGPPVLDCLRRHAAALGAARGSRAPESTCAQATPTPPTTRSPGRRPALEFELAGVLGLLVELVVRGAAAGRRRGHPLRRRGRL